MIDQNSQFLAILTAVGEAKQANADALGIPWLITHMGVGDANGADPIPDRLQTRLINERRRAPLNQLTTDDKNPGLLIAEQVIPAEVGGWWVREVGLYDGDGDLVAVSNCAPSYKPLLTQGSGRTQVVRMTFIISSTANVVLKIDPSVVLATRSYVDDSIYGVLPPSRLAGTYTKVTTDKRGLVIRGESPDTLAGYGIQPASQAEAESGEKHDNSKPMTALRVWQAITKSVPQSRPEGTYTKVTTDNRGVVTKGENPNTLAGYGIAAANQAEAEAGEKHDNSKPMTALRVWQAVAKAVPHATETVLGRTQLATHSQVNAGADDRVAVTPRKLRWGFRFLKERNGYIAFPEWMGGFLIQWGTSGPYLQLTVGEIEARVTFPIVFPSTALMAFINHSGTARALSSGAAISGHDKSGLNAWLANTHPGQGVTVRWLAIGY